MADDVAAPETEPAAPALPTTRELLGGCLQMLHDIALALVDIDDVPRRLRVIEYEISRGNEQIDELTRRVSRLERAIGELRKPQSERDG